MGNPKDIFKNHSNLTEEEIQKYLSGDLTESERRKIELKLSQDGFNAEAMEGFALSSTAFSKYAETRTEALKMIDQKSGGWQFYHTMIVCGVLLIGTMLLGPMLFPESGTTMKPEETTSISQEKPMEIAAVPLPELSDEEIEIAIELPEIELVKAKEVIASSPFVLDSSLAQTQSEKQESLEKILKIKKVDNPVSATPIELPNIDDIVYSNVPLIYIENFLMVNYSKIYTQTPVIEKTVISGTPASKADSQDELNELYATDIKTISIPYKDYLIETQQLFAKHNFKSALKRYKVILNAYPEDLNAHFYSGLCYFNLGKYDLAIQHLDLAEKHAYNTFSIDAEWYKAKTYYQQGKLESCKKILNQIIADGDYYTAQATALLQKIK